MLYISYENSILATIISLIGEVLLIPGVILMFSGSFFSGLCMAGIGGLIMFGARKSSQKKAEKEERNFR